MTQISQRKSFGYFQVIPAKSHSSAKVSFYPYTEDSSGELCTAYAAAYMSLDHQVSYRDHLEYFSRFLVFGLHEIFPTRLEKYALIETNVEPEICGPYTVPEVSSFKHRLCVS